MLTADRVLELLDYDPETGHFRWRVTKGSKRMAGEVAGCLYGKGYWSIGIDRRLYYAHRLAWLYVHGEWPKRVIDHINRDKLDNRIVNLRDVTISENGLNQKSVRGFYFDKSRGKYMAYIQVNGKARTKRFDTADEAAAWRTEALNAARQEQA